MKKYLHFPLLITIISFSVFFLSQNSFAQYRKLHDFTDTLSGISPGRSLISDGTFLYGMTTNGGTSDSGTVFKIMPDGTGFTKLFDFNGTNGSTPYASLLYDGTFLYGMTSEGGTNYGGVIFKIKPDGSSFTKLLDFNYINGGNPYGTLVSDGTFLYGVTLYGGANNFGLVFKIKPDGTSYTKLHDFNNNSDGIYPQGIMFDGTFLYGTTTSNGLYGGGTFYKIMPDGTAYSKLFDFTGAVNGSNPIAALIFDGTFFYGTTQAGGSGGGGVIYKIRPDGSGDTILLHFDGSFNSPTGNQPFGGLISDGTFLYGMTNSGGTNGVGTLFKIMPDGTGFTILMNFSGQANGSLPEGSLLLTGNYLYGTTYYGGASNYNGTIFKFNLLCSDTTINRSATICSGQSLTVGVNTYTVSGNYVDSLISYQGCDSIINTQLTVNPLPTAIVPSNIIVCAGAAVFTTSFSSTVPGSTYLWTNSNTSTGLIYSNGAGDILGFNAVNNSGIPITSTISVTAMAATCVGSASVYTIDVDPVPNVNAGSDTVMCSGGSAVIGSSSVGGVTYNWTPSTGLSGSTVSDPIASPASSTLYVLTATQNGCAANDTINITITNSITIGGTVNFLGNPVIGGTVTAYLISGTNAFSDAGTTGINGSGNYSFSSLLQGNYFIKAEIDTAQYIGAVASYSSSFFAWSDADTVSTSCGGVYNENIEVIQTAILTGTGTISGMVFGGNGPLKTWQQGDPIPGVDVSLEQHPGSVMLAQTSTDAAGAYTFSNVPIGNYSIYVDVPGLSMSATYDVNITADNKNFTDALFYVDSMGTIDTVRAIVLGMKPGSKLTNNISVYPNPYSSYTNISYLLSEKSNVNIEVYNVLGEKVSTLINATKDAGKYSEKFSAKNYNAGAGIYFVKITINGNLQTVRLVETN